MIHRIVNSSGIISLAILVISAILLWSRVFIAKEHIVLPCAASPLYNLVYLSIGGFKIISAFVCIAMIILTAIVVNFVLAGYDLIPRSSYIAAYIFVLITAIFSDFILLSPFIFVGIILIILSWQLFGLYDKSSSLSLVFNMGFLVSVASMFYFPCILFLLWIWITFLIYRIFLWRSWFISIIGFGLPYLFLSSWYFVNGNLGDKLSVYLNALQFIDLSGLAPDLFVWIVIAILGALSLISAARFLKISNERPIKIRKFLAVMIWFYIIVLFCVMISANYFTFGAGLLLLPLTLMIPVFLSSLKRKVITDWIFLLLLFLVISERLGLWDML